MRSTPDGSQWRGWDETSAGNRGLVTSARLGADAPVQNRMFPKVRSWFALGAPLELLSPLSVVRIVLILQIVVAAVLLAGPDAIRVVPVVATIVVTVGLLVGLSRVKELGPRSCIELGSVATLITGVYVWAGDARGEALLSVMVLIPVAVFVGLFFRMRALLAQQLLVVSVVAVALVATSADVASTFVIPGLTLLGTGTAALTVALTSASARRKAMIDSDTGIPNGYGLADELAGRLEREPTVVATIVLRGLDEAREALGHRAGTELLRRAVEDLGQVLPGDARIGRGAGDQLIVVQPARDVDVDATAGIELAEHLAVGIGSGRYLVDGIEVLLRAHVGFVVAPLDGMDATELIRRSSLSARHARTSGQAYAHWGAAMTDAMTSADLALLADLRLAPERGELSMAYQPQIDPETGATVAVEALIRWSSPTHGSVPPDAFIPLAERTGLIDRLTEWVFAETLDAQVRWRRVGLHLPVSVNVSAGSLSDPELSTRILGELEARRLPSNLLTVEVTETAALDADQAVDRLGALHDKGVGVSIDDFGTGYTSLAVLPHLPIDELKVDQRFVIASSTSDADDAIVRSVLELAHQLGLKAVAEGVEDEATWTRLRAYGFDLLQGWAFSKALPESELISFVCRAPHACIGGITEPAPESAPEPTTAPASVSLPRR